MHVPRAASARPRFGRATARALARLVAAIPLGICAAFVAGGSTSAAGCGGTAPTVEWPGVVVVRDSFESGSIRTNWAVTDEGDAWAGITTTVPRRGLCAGRVIVSSSSTSRANLHHGLPTGTDEVWASGWFRVDRQGYSGSNVPTFRFFNGSQRILDVFRANGTGLLWIRTRTSSGSWRYVSLNRYMPLHTWTKIAVHLRTSWSSSVVSVRINDVRLYANTSYSLPASRLTTTMVGAEHTQQLGDFSVDDVVITAP